MLLVLFIEKRYLNSSMVNTGIMVLSGMSIYFGVLYLRKDKFFISNVEILLEKLRVEMKKRLG